MSFMWVADSPQSTVLHAVPNVSALNEFVYPWYEIPGLPPCSACIDRLTAKPWTPDPTRPHGHYVTPRPAWLDDTGEAPDKSPIVVVPATPVDDLDASPWIDVPAMPLGVQGFANTAGQAGCAVTITYASAIIPPHTTKTDNPTTTPAYVVESFAARFRRTPSAPGTFPHRPGVQGYAMWERKHKNDRPAWTTAGAGYRNHMTQGQFPGVTELSRLLKEGLL